jgi:hypothetical protein
MKLLAHIRLLVVGLELAEIDIEDQRRSEKKAKFEVSSRA